MRNIICTGFFILLINLSWGQQAEANLRDMPNFIPPAPTVNALMKFEEVPVSNYTGIPDITIPIVNLDTDIKNIPVNISLKYHVSNAKPEDKASEVGTGWSLFAGGTISRTVMDGPDDKIVSYQIGGKKKIGIYFDENTNINIDKNYFHRIIDGVPDNSINVDKMMFEAYFHNKYDSQYDLYQYNFINNTGRFILKKNLNNQLIVVKLDKNNLKIKVNHTANFEPTSFEITDEYGNIFLFDILETSKTSVLSDSSDMWGYQYTNTSIYSGTDFNSAFHLSTIKNSNNSTKVLLKYTIPQSIINTDTTTFNKSYDITFYSHPHQIQVLQVNKSLLPKVEETIISSIITNTRKISEIEIVNKGKIIFEYENGRNDTNYTGALNASKLSKLKSIIVKNNNQDINEKFDFNYSYKNFHEINRLFLNSVEKKYLKNSNFTLDHSYTLEYYGLPITNQELELDKWRYSKCKEQVGYNYFTRSSDCVSVGLLKSVQYPTKGKAEFNYEANTYSYIPENNTIQPSTSAFELINFDDNELNWNQSNPSITINSFGSTEKYAFTVPANNIISVPVKILINVAEISQYDWVLSILKKNGTNYELKKAIGTGINNDPIPDNITLGYQKYLQDQIQILILFLIFFLR